MAEPFAAALKRYIRSGYAAPEAMKAAWHDVKVGRVERPRRPGRRYRRSVAALPGRSLLNQPRHMRTGRRNPDGTERLVDAAAQIAMRAAAEYLRRHNLEADPEALVATLRAWLKIKLPEGLRDARQALEAGMGKVAEQTFAASMAQAGIEAAKEAGFPKGSRGNPPRHGRRNPWGIPSPPSVTAAKARALARRFGMRPPRVGYCVQLAPGLELCRDAQGYYVIGTMPARGVPAPTGSTRRAPARNPRLYQMVPGGRDVDLGRFPTYKRAAAHAREIQRRYGGEFLIRGGRGRRTEERYVGPRANPWATYAGGTGAHHGYSYDIRGAFGEYHVWPPSTRRGGYSLKWANTRGLPAPHSGLWHDLGVYRSPQAAKGAARRHAAALGVSLGNPPRWRRALTVPERHQRRIARQTLRMPAAMVGVMGGPSKAEARRILRRLRSNPTMVAAAELRPGDVILPPARELTLWMRRHIREKGLPESALELTVVSIREGEPDKRGRWLIITTRQAEAWYAGRPAQHPFVFKARPATPWPLIRAGTRANPRQRRRPGGREPEYSEARGHVRSLFNEEYWRAMRRGEYFRWAAGKPFVGRDPLTGREERTPTHRRAERECRKAQARVWFDQARHIREASRRGVLPNRLTKLALRRAPGYPVGQSAPLELHCPCGEILRVPASGRVTCPRCGAVYDRQGWLITPARSNPRRRFRPERLADPRAFDPRSLRTVRAGGHRVTVGCPRGQWDPRRRRCRTATRAQRVLHPRGRRNPTAAVCALCRREPRAPLSPYCRKCLRLFQRPPRRNPLTRGETADVLQGARAWRRFARGSRGRLQSYYRGRREEAIAIAHRHGAGRRVPTMGWAGRRSEFYPFRKNTPRGGVVIYDRLLELRAVKGRRSHYPGQRFKHAFTSRAKVIGLPDGSVLLKGPRPLWKRVEV